VWSVRKPSDNRIAGDEREDLSGKVVEMLHLNLLLAMP